MTALREIVTPSLPADSLGDLLRRLGGISPDRIRMHPAIGTATAADVAAIAVSEKRLFELVEGVLVEKCTGYRESILALAVGAALRNWVVARNLGVVSGADGMMRLFPGLVLIPDVAFASWARFPGGKVSEDAVPQLVPDLVVEVLSQSNSEAEIKRKRGEYFRAGVQLVWLVDGKSRTVVVHTGAEEFKMLGEDQTLDGGSVLPGFTLELKELFAAMGNSR